MWNLVKRQLPSKELLQNYGRSSKFSIAAKYIPNLQFNVGETENNSQSQGQMKNSLEGTQEVVEIMESDALIEDIIMNSKDCQRNSEVRESSVNLLKSVADVGLKLKDTTKVWITFRMKLQGKHGKSHKHSEKSRCGATGVALQCVIPRKTLEPVNDTDCKGTTSKTSEYWENSLSGEEGVGE